VKERKIKGKKETEEKKEDARELMRQRRKQEKKWKAEVKGNKRFQ
jgi:hypothetical protein